MFAIYLISFVSSLTIPKYTIINYCPAEKEEACKKEEEETNTMMEELKKNIDEICKKIDEKECESIKESMESFNGILTTTSADINAAFGKVKKDTDFVNYYTFGAFPVDQAIDFSSFKNPMNVLVISQNIGGMSKSLDLKNITFKVIKTLGKQQFDNSPTATVRFEQSMMKHFSKMQSKEKKSVQNILIKGGNHNNKVMFATFSGFEVNIDSELSIKNLAFIRTTFITNETPKINNEYLLVDESTLSTMGSVSYKTLNFAININGQASSLYFGLDYLQINSKNSGIRNIVFDNKPDIIYYF